jgi:hypothetical protein
MTKQLAPTVLQGSGIGKIIDTPEEQDALDTALERAHERGRVWLAEFKTKSEDEQVEIIADYIYHYVRGGEMGSFGFDELPPKPLRNEDDKSMCQEAYLDAARFVARLYR